MRMNALWWWIDRWRKSTAYTDMTLEEQGAYRNLLDEANLRGGAIPNDERILGKACGDAIAWTRVRSTVMARFELQADGWHNVTLDEVIKQSERRAEKQARYRNNRSNPDGNGGGNTGGSPSPSPTDNNEPPLSPPATAGGPIAQGPPQNGGTNGTDPATAARAELRRIKVQAEQARQFAIEMHEHPSTQHRKQFRKWLLAGWTLDEVKDAIRRREHMPPLRI